MKKWIVAVAVLGLMSNGCAWLGFGDDSESATTQTNAAAAEEQAAPDPAPAADPQPAKKSASKKESKATAKRGGKSEAQIKAELDKMGAKLVQQSARTLLPNKANPEYRKVGNEWIASYVSVDTHNVTTEMKPGANGQYVGIIRYQERFMECRGASKQAAVNGPCTQTRSRRMSELIRYDGKVWQD